MRAIAAGPNVLPPRPGDWTHGLTIVFDSTAAMVEEFVDHPVQQAVLRNQLPLVGHYTAMDVESAS